MVADIPTDLLRAVWGYPFFDTLYGRRTRRFGLGFETAQGPYQYRSSKAPVPLCEEEEALLVAAGIGFSGMALWDQSPAAAVPEQRRPNLPRAEEAVVIIGIQVVRLHQPHQVHRIHRTGKSAVGLLDVIAHRLCAGDALFADRDRAIAMFVTRNAVWHLRTVGGAGVDRSRTSGLSTASTAASMLSK